MHDRSDFLAALILQQRAAGPQGLLVSVPGKAVVAITDAVMVLQDLAADRAEQLMAWPDIDEQTSHSIVAQTDQLHPSRIDAGNASFRIGGDDRGVHAGQDVGGQHLHVPQRPLAGQVPADHEGKSDRRRQDVDHQQDGQRASSAANLPKVHERLPDRFPGGAGRSARRSPVRGRRRAESRR